MLCPRGMISGAEASAIRSRCALAEVVGKVTRGDAWTLLELPPSLFRPLVLPRVLTVHAYSRTEEVEAVLGGQPIGTLSGDPALAAVHGARYCAIGEMQAPAASRWHDGVDVIGALTRAHTA